MKTKSLWRTVLAALFLSAFMGGCKDDYTSVDGVCPLVLTTDPANLATNVALDKVITVTFNEAMNPATITPAAFSLYGPGTAGGRIATGARSMGTEILGSLKYDGATHSMVFTPTNKLTSGITYTGTVMTSVKDMMGNALQVNYVWTFSTGATASPTVISTDPVDTDTGVVLNKVVTATFSVAMDPLTITSSTFLLKQGTTAIAGAVTYAGTTASFTPTANLTPSTLYTATITTGAKNVAGTIISSNYVWSFTTGAGVAPTITLVDPLNLATGVALNKVVTATFSEAMNATTLNTTTFNLKAGATVVPGAVTYAGTIASFTPTSPLVSGTLYTATITTGAKNVAGTALAGVYVWTFTTVTAPTVTSVDPLNLATGVALNKVIGATFSTAMDQLTLTNLTFTLKAGTIAVPGAVAYAGTTATFTPTNPLLGGTLYTATVTTGAKDAAGTPLASDFVWTFTTIAAIPPTVLSTDPLNLATNVPLNKVISATFSEAMDPLTITGLTFTLKLGATSIPGAVNYSGTTATFTPSIFLLSDATYTATITTGAKNVAGTPIAVDYVWNFNTVPHLGPLFVDLLSVARFGIIAGVGVSNNAGFSVINNLDVGIYPGARSSITGFPPAIVVGGAIYAADDAAPVPAMLLQAQNDLTAAYNFAAGATSPAPALAPADLGGQTLAPGIWTSATSMLLQNGDLTLDAQGDANAVWIFQIGSTLTSIGSGPFPSASGGSVILAGGAQAKNVFWQVGSSATIGDYTHFKGNILAFSSITMNTGSVADGRMLARNASVVMTSTNIINKP